MDDMAFMADYPERMQQERREEVAQLQAERLMAQWEALQAARAATVTAKKYEASERQKYTDMLASALRITVGMRVTTTRRTWKRKEATTKTYEVTHYTLDGATTLSLTGRTVRKDGTIGAVFEIGADWKRVAA
jgi:hypothetical protein